MGSRFTVGERRGMIALLLVVAVIVGLAAMRQCGSSTEMPAPVAEEIPSGDTVRFGSKKDATLKPDKEAADSSRAEKPAKKDKKKKKDKKSDGRSSMQERPRNILDERNN